MTRKDLGAVTGLAVTVVASGLASIISAAMAEMTVTRKDLGAVTGLAVTVVASGLASIISAAMAADAGATNRGTVPDGSLLAGAMAVTRGLNAATDLMVAIRTFIG